MMRFARSGHLDRHDEVEQKRLERASLPSTKRRLGVVAAALGLPVTLAVVVTTLWPAPPPSPATASAPTTSPTSSVT